MVSAGRRGLERKRKEEEDKVLRDRRENGEWKNQSTERWQDLSQR